MFKHQIDPWKFLRAGQTERGIAEMKEAYRQWPTPSHIMELGVALVWLGRTAEALKHFDDVLRHYPHHSAAFRGMAGVANWCNGDRTAAVAQWDTGLESDFTDAAGGVEMPLLLHFSSIFDARLYPRSKAEAILRERASMSAARNWPGPLAKFVLKQIDEATLRGSCTGFNELDTLLRHWRGDFYIAASDLAKGRRLEFGQLCAGLVRDADSRSVDESTLTAFLWNEEYFIARHEAIQDDDCGRRTI